MVWGFRFALGIVLFMGIAAGAIGGGLIGAIASFGSTGAIVIGVIIGGMFGWIGGAYAHGIGYTLLSINDHLAAMAKSGLPQAAASSGEVAEADDGAWRDRLPNPPVSEPAEINGMLVWKLRDADGNAYYSGHKTYKSLDELLGRAR